MQQQFVLISTSPAFHAVSHSDDYNAFSLSDIVCLYVFLMLKIRELFVYNPDFRY